MKGATYTKKNEDGTVEYGEVIVMWEDGKLTIKTDLPCDEWTVPATTIDAAQKAFYEYGQGLIAMVMGEEPNAATLSGIYYLKNGEDFLKIAIDDTIDP